MPDHPSDQGTSDPSVIERLNCPSCGVGFAIPKNVDKFKGKRSRCQVCSAPFRFSADGLSLTAVVEAPPSSPAGGPAPAAEPAGSGQEAFPEIDLGLDRPVQVEPTPKRPLLPWAVAAVAVAVAALAPTLWLALGSSRKEGTILLQLDSPVVDVTLAVDGKAIALEQLRGPLTLPVGPHRLDASGRGLVAFHGILPVFEGANPPFPVRLAAVPKPVAAPAGAEAPKPAAPEADADAGAGVVAQTTNGAAEAPDEMPTGKAEPDPAVVGDMATAKVEADPRILDDMPAGRVEADPRILDDMPAGKVEADPGILGPEAKAGPKADVTLKQIAADPESYLDASVIPFDLLLIDTGTVGGPAGKRPGALELQLAIKSKDGAYRDAIKPGTSFEIRLTNENAAAIRDQVRTGNLVGGEYPAIVKFKMTKDSANPKGFVGLVEWVELLIYVDPRPIYNGKHDYHKVFTVMRVADGKARLAMSDSSEGWRKKLLSTNNNIFSKLKNAYGQAYTLNFGVEYNKLVQLLRTQLSANSRMFHDKLMGQLRGR